MKLYFGRDFQSFTFECISTPCSHLSHTSCFICSLWSILEKENVWKFVKDFTVPFIWIRTRILRVITFWSRAVFGKHSFLLCRITQLLHCIIRSEAPVRTITYLLLFFLERCAPVFRAQPRPAWKCANSSSESLPVPYNFWGCLGAALQ